MSLAGKGRRGLLGLTVTLALFCSWGLLIFSFFQMTYEGCDDLPLPVTYTVDGEEVQCGWNWVNSLCRITLSLFCLLPVLSLMYGLFKKKKLFLVLTVFLCFLFCAAFFTMLYFDGKSLHASYAWCSDEPEDSCKMYEYIGLVSVEAFVGLVWVLEAFVIVVYLAKFSTEDFADWKHFDYGDKGYETEDSTWQDVRRAI